MKTVRVKARIRVMVGVRVRVAPGLRAAHAGLQG